MPARPTRVRCPRCTLTARVIPRHRSNNFIEDQVPVMRCEQSGCMRRYHEYWGSSGNGAPIQARVDPEWLDDWLKPEHTAYARAGETKRATGKRPGQA